MKPIKLLLLFVLLPLFLTEAQDNSNEILLSNRNDGTIPAWLVAGPYEYPLIGFGIPKDTAAIGEPDITPVGGDFSTSVLTEKEKQQWILQSTDNRGYVDFHKTISWNVNTSVPVKIWYSRGTYAYNSIVSESEKEALLTLGSNSNMKVYLNGEVIYIYDESRNALKDQDTVKIRLRKGSNDILVSVKNTHNNLGLAYFGVINWEWGFFARLLDLKGAPLKGIKYLLRTNNNSDFDLTSTIYFKKNENQLKQRIDLEINSLNPETISASLSITNKNETFNFSIDSVAFGKTRHSFYIPEIENTSEARADLKLGSELINKTVILEKRRKYKLHVMLLNHTDIGYTHPQPVIEEIHSNTLDDVIKMCREHPDFHWTIETTWQMEAYEKQRSPEKFLELIKLVKEGRIAVSPIYTNPFTGWISEEEMIRSLDKAMEYQRKYGIQYSGAVYNDVPGQAWFLPQVLSKAGVKFLAEGINEVYSDYILQRNLPKIFKWEAADGSSVVTYLNEAYNEGRSYGLESGNLLTVEQMLWERITKLEARDYKPDIILINTSFSDNSILAGHQYLNSLKWNEEFEYPKFISSNVDKFTSEIVNSEVYNQLPVLRGDWTSNWDIFYQGEFERNKTARLSQYKLIAAEKLSTLSHLLDDTRIPMDQELSDAYRNAFLFSGHGSGLEFGYGSPEDNKLTMDYRQNYVRNAFIGAESVLLKSLHRISKPEESLDSEGLLVFNSLSWRRNDLVEIQYPFESSPQYEVVDAVTSKVVPSIRKGHLQYFVAEDVPSFGYKKYMLKPGFSAAAKTGNLITDANSIENQFYKIVYDPLSKSVVSIKEKGYGNELINNESYLSFCVPSVEQFQLDKMYSSLNDKNAAIEIIDERPVRTILKIKYEDQVTEFVEFSLIEGVDKIFVRAGVNLAVLNKTSLLSEYGLPFSFNIPDAQVQAEILGGFIDFNADRLPGVDHDGASIRSSVSVYNKERNIVWSTADARVIRIRTDSISGKPVVISNTVNHFPEDWNRHEDLNGKIEFRYTISSADGSFSPSRTSMQGYELNTPLHIRKSWFRSVPGSEEYFITNNPSVILLNLKSADEGFIIRLLNTDSRNSHKAKITSRFFRNAKAEQVDLMGKVILPMQIKENILDVNLKPGEVSDFLIKSINK